MNASRFLAHSLLDTLQKTRENDQMTRALACRLQELSALVVKSCQGMEKTFHTAILPHNDAVGDLRARVKNLQECVSA